MDSEKATPLSEEAASKGIAATTMREIADV